MIFGGDVAAEAVDGALEVGVIGRGGGEVVIAVESLDRDGEGGGEEGHDGLAAAELEEGRSEKSGGKDVVGVDVEDAGECGGGGFHVAESAGDDAESVVAFGVTGPPRAGGSVFLEREEFSFEELIDVLIGGCPGCEVVAELALAQAVGNVGGEVSSREHSEEEVAELGERQQWSGGLGRWEESIFLARGSEDEAGVGGEERVDRRCGRAGSCRWRGRSGPGGDRGRRC